MDGARVGQGVRTGERHVAIDLPLIHEDVAAGDRDIAGDPTEIVERLPRPAEELDRAVDLAAVGQRSDRGLRACAIDRVRPRAVCNRPGVGQRRDRAGIRKSRAAGAACVARAAVSAADCPAVGQRRDRAGILDPRPPAPPTPAVAPPFPPFPPLMVR